MKRPAIEALEPLAKRRAVFLPTLRAALRNRDQSHTSLGRRIAQYVQNMSRKAAPTLLPKLQDGFNNIKKKFLARRRAARRRALLRRNRAPDICQRRGLAPFSMRLPHADDDGFIEDELDYEGPQFDLRYRDHVYHGQLYHRHQRVFAQWWESRRQDDLKTMGSTLVPAPKKLGEVPLLIILVTTPDGATHDIDDMPDWSPPLRSRRAMRREAKWMKSTELSPRWGPWKKTYPFLKFHKRRLAAK